MEIKSVTFAANKPYPNKNCMLKIIDRETLCPKMVELSGVDESTKKKELEDIFLDNISHELRTPLNALIGLNDLLNGVAGQHMEEEDRLIMKDHIHKNADRLMTVMDDILDLSRMQKGSLTIHKTVVSLMEICCKARDAVKGQVQPGVKLQHEYPVALKDTFIYTDGKRLEQLLRNFLLNACHHTELGSITLKVKAYRDEKRGRRMLQIRVDDTGEGIPHERRSLLFKPFRKFDGQMEGLGLGLAICRQIAKLLGGVVYLNTHYVGGSSFVFEMPIEEI